MILSQAYMTVGSSSHGPAEIFSSFLPASKSGGYSHVSVYRWICPIRPAAWVGVNSTFSMAVIIITLVELLATGHDGPQRC